MSPKPLPQGMEMPIPTAPGTSSAGEIGLELHEPETSRPLIDQINNFAIEAAGCELDSFILGVRTTSTAVAAGVRYIEGKPVWPAVAEPRHAFTHVMEDLYPDSVAI